MIKKIKNGISGLKNQKMRNKITIGILALLIMFVIVFFSPKYNNNITGKDVYTKVEILNVVPSNCNFTLYEGWNYVSFHCISSSVPITSVLSSINSSYSKVFTYNSFDTTDPWKSYNPELPNWVVQDLRYMGRTSGYIILIKNDTQYFYEGYKRSSIIQLNNQWNLIGYPLNYTSNITDFLAGINYNEILTYENNTLLFYIPNATNNTLLYFYPNKAYWIKSSAIQNIIVN